MLRKDIHGQTKRVIMTAQRAPITEALIAQQYPDVGKLQRLIDAAVDRVDARRDDFPLTLVECEDVGVVAALFLHHSEYSNENELTAYLIPDLRLLAITEGSVLRRHPKPCLITAADFHMNLVDVAPRSTKGGDAVVFMLENVASIP